ncbi:response regulator [bacterium]|nr:response regulator [bacterium]
MRVPCVLIVDDTSFVRKMVRLTLEPEGFQFLEAKNGIEAEEILQQHKEVSVVILDVDMPLQDGITTLRNLRNNGNHVPVIMLTANKKKEILREATRLGICAFFTKPFQEDRFREKVNRAVQATPLSDQKSQPDSSRVDVAPISEIGLARSPVGISPHFKILVVDAQPGSANEIRVYLEERVDEVYCEPDFDTARRVIDWISPQLILVNLEQSTRAEAEGFIAECSARNSSYAPCLISYRSPANSAKEIAAEPPQREFEILNLGSIDPEKLNQVIQDLGSGD